MSQTTAQKREVLTPQERQLRERAAQVFHSWGRPHELLQPPDMGHLMARLDKDHKAVFAEMVLAINMTEESLEAYFLSGFRPGGPGRRFWENEISLLKRDIADGFYGSTLLPVLNLFYQYCREIRELDRDEDSSELTFEQTVVNAFEALRDKGVFMGCSTLSEEKNEEQACNTRCI